MSRQNTPSVIARLLRACAQGSDAKKHRHDIIFTAAAELLEMMGDRCVPIKGEPSFRLLGRDPQAPYLVQQWALDRARLCQADDKVESALAIANEMRDFKRTHPGLGLSTGWGYQLQTYHLEMSLINALRADEGNSVNILCPGPDFNDQPDQAIEVTAQWGKSMGDWRTQRFAADTLLECLQMAANTLNEVEANGVTG